MNQIVKEEETTYDVIVIGGGASGMMAAARAGTLGKRVLILEKNPTLGAKLAITGGKRCNITNAEHDIRILLKHYGAAEQFLYSAFSHYGVQQTFTLFETLGLPLVVQAHNRAFPHTEKAKDVVRALEKYLTQGNVEIKTNAKVSRIEVEHTRITHVLAGKQKYVARSYIIATGGLSHPETGSTGDGFKWLKALGHTIETPTPTIVPIAVQESWVHALAGIAIPHMKITFFTNGKKAFSKSGKLLCTHFGLSGPLILNTAGLVYDLLQEGTVTATIDLFPDLDTRQLEQKLIALFESNKNKLLKNVFGDIVPPGMSSILTSVMSPIDPETKVHSITRDERLSIATTLKSLFVTITELMGFDRAVVADGGIPLTEIDMKTMRSMIVENMYVTGDLLHITRPSGGFSLQLCWTTGYVAGSTA